jgi:nitroimidazol reductase NimA-like FMN-containing flavoprotein (pyridoxamine 5'-phosphate oxidase superfamily)
MTSRGTTTISEHDCLTLLRKHSFGRVGVTIAGDIIVLPVYYAVLRDEEIVFRTDPGTKLSAGLLGIRVAFEVDSRDPPWSVLVRGHAHEMRDTEAFEAARNEIPDEWPTGERERIVRISIEKITGRRLPDDE